MKLKLYLIRKGCAVMYRRWTVARPDAEAEALLCSEFGIEPAAARVAAARGLDTIEAFSEFFSDDGLEFDPFSLNGVAEASSALLSAVENGEKILIFGDYDCDGVTSTALMYLHLSALGAEAAFKIPDRESDGYGLTEKFVEAAARDGVKTIVTVDNGISCIKEAELAKKLGIKLIVTDHHMPPEQLPEAEAIVDPHIGEAEQFKCLAGVGVAFVVACAMSGVSPSELIWDYGDLVALGTVADVMPLTGINRAIVRLGLDAMNSGRRLGIEALLQAAGQSDRELTATALSFTLAPRINAAGRIGSAEAALQLLLSDEPETAAGIAARINEMNVQRQRIEQSIVDEAADKIEKNGYNYDRIIVVSGENWHQGVVGISASKLAERYGRPVVVLAEKGEASVGSCRGVAGFSLFAALNEVSELLLRYGGHELAAGLTLRTEDIGELRRRLNALPEAKSMPFMTVKTDCVLEPEEATLDTAYALSEFEPCGAGNPVPVFLLKAWTLEKITPLSNGSHQRLTVSKNGLRHSALLFGVRSEELTVFQGDTVDIAVTLNIGEFRGEETLSLYVRAIRPSGSGGSECEAAVRRYEDFRAGRLDGAETEKMLPTREDFAAVYRFLSKRTVCRRDAVTAALGKSCGYDRCEACLDALCEAGLAFEETRNGYSYVSKTARTEKADLSKTATVLRLKALEKGGCA